MKNHKYFLSLVLVAVLLVALAACLMVRVFLPAANLPVMNIPNMALLSVVALLIEHFLAPHNPRCYWFHTIFSAVCFGVLPLMAGFACVHDFWKLGLVGGAVFTATTFLFTSATQRIATGPKATCAVVITALGICLAAQGLVGILI